MLPELSLQVKDRLLCKQTLCSILIIKQPSFDNPSTESKRSDTTFQRVIFCNRISHARTRLRTRQLECLATCGEDRNVEGSGADPSIASRVADTRHDLRPRSYRSRLVEARSCAPARRKYRDSCLRALDHRTRFPSFFLASRTRADQREHRVIRITRRILSHGFFAPRGFFLDNPTTDDRIPDVHYLGRGSGY